MEEEKRGQGKAGPGSGLAQGLTTSLFRPAVYQLQTKGLKVYAPLNKFATISRLPTPSSSLSPVFSLSLSLSLSRSLCLSVCLARAPGYFRRHSESKIPRAEGIRDAALRFYKDCIALFAMKYELM